MRPRSTLALTATVVGITMAATVPSPAFAAVAKYPGDYCEDASGNLVVPAFGASVSRPVIRTGQTTTYTLRFYDPFNHVEIGFFVNGVETAGTIIHHEESSVARITLRPREDTTVTWSGAIFCSPDMHYDMGMGLSPASVQVVKPRRPWNRIVQVQRSLFGEAQQTASS